MMKLSDDDRAFMSGFALAIADLARRHDEPTVAAGLIAGHGFRLKDFAGVDETDLRVIRKLFRTESQLRANQRAG